MALVCVILILCFSDSKLDQIQLMILDQVSATLAPWDTRPRAPHAVVAPIVQFNRANHTAFPLQSALEHGLGGKEYVQTGLFSTLGHFLGMFISYSSSFMKMVYSFSLKNIPVKFFQYIQSIS